MKRQIPDFRIIVTLAIILTILALTSCAGSLAARNSKKAGWGCPAQHTADATPSYRHKG
jgi:hypothetical protein